MTTKTLKSIALVLLCTVLNINYAWGEVTSPITLTTNSTTITGWTSGSVEYTNLFDYKLTFSGVSGTSATKVQNAKNSNIYNTIAIPGAITSIKLTGCETTSTKTDGSFTIYGGTTQAGCTNEIEEVTGLSSTAADKTVNFNSADNYTFFKITIGSARVLKISSIVISFSTGGTSYTLSSAVSPAASGSVTLGATSLAEDATTTATAVPADGYVFTSWAISGTGASLSSTTTNPTTVTMGTADATITATFVVKTAATITLSDADGTTNPTGYFVGDEYTLPSTAGSCAGKVLVGWSTVTVATTDTKPTSNFYAKGAKATLASTQTFYAVYAKETAGSDISLSEDDSDDNMANGVGTTGWTISGTGAYSGNGVKFDGVNDYIQSPDISSHALTTVIVKLKAGYNTGSGSVLTIASYDAGGEIIDSETFTPTEVYTSQSTVNTFTLSGSSVVKYVRVTMTSKTNNLGMKYCDVFSPGATYSKYATSCVATECETPTFSPEAGTYTSAQNVTITCSTPGAAIHYTTDGTDPTGSSPTYSSPISVSSTTTIKAIATKADLDNSAIATATYTIVEAEEFILVEDAASLNEDDEIIILNADGDKAMSTTQNSNNRGSVASGEGIWTLSGKTATVISADVQVLTLKKVDSYWELYDAVNDGYLYAAGSGSGNNYLRTQVSNNANGQWAIEIETEIASIIAQGSSTNNVMQNNGSLFACYSTASQTDVKIYRKDDTTPKYDVTVSIPAGHGSATQSAEKIKETTGKITITCVPDAGYTINTVTASNGTITSTGVENEYQLTGVTGNTTVTISYRKLWDITVTTDGHGTATLSSPYADTGGSVTLTLTPKAGYGEPITVDKTSGTAIVGAVSAGSCTISSISSDVELAVSFTKLPSFTVTFNAGNGNINGDPTKDIKETYRGTGVYAPTAIPSPACSGDWEFVYWSTTNQTSETSSEPAHAVNAGDKYVPASDGITLYAIYRHTESSGAETTVTDNITLSTTGVSGTSYTDWSDVTVTSAAVYTGNNAGGNSAIQLRSSKSTAGIVSTTSGGKIRNVTVTWNGNTSAGRKISIWGSNEAYTAPSSLYAAATRGTGLGTIDYDVTTSLDIEGDYAYVGIRSTDGALYLNQISITWATGTSAVYSYCTSPTCEACTEPTHKFASATAVLTYPHVGTYNNTFTTDNTGDKAFKSSDKSVATVNPSTGDVTVVGLGTTTISVHIGKTAGKCAVDDSYELTVKEPTVEVVEVTNNNEIIIEHDFGGSTNALIDQLVTHEEGNVAEEVFFSKYFEASANVKLVAIYNGTGKAVDPTKLRVRIVSGGGTSTHIVNLSTYFTAADMPNGKEIILYSWKTVDATDKKIIDCAEGKADMSSWVEISWSTYSSSFPGIIFGGDAAVVLEQTNDGGSSWEVLDIIGALTADGKKADTSNCGTASWADHTGWYTTEGNELGVDPETNDYGIGTVRCLLVRKFDVLSGKDARNTTTGNWGTGNFNTLASEWYGRQVGNATGEYTNSCNAFSEVGSFDYYSNYQKYEEMNTDAFTATDNGDGTMTIKINPPHTLAEMSCNFLKIKVTNAAQTEVLSELEYRVPIIVSGDKMTNDAIFTTFGAGDDACAICDVAILQDATLTPHASGKNILHDVEVYRGAKLTIPSDKELTVNNLILRSKGDLTPQADIQGTLNRFDTKLYFDKRVDETRWYWITLPYDCEMGDVILKDETKPTYGVGKDWVLKYYDGQKRANTQAGGCWTVLPEGSTIQKGKGYILGVTPKAGHDFLELRFPMSATAWDKDPARASIAVPVMATKSAGITPNHVGWNLVGNPYITHYKPSYVGMDHADNSNNLIPLGILEPDGTEYKRTNDDVRYVVIPQNGGYSEYEQIAIGSQAIPTFISYFIQIGGTADTEYAVDFKYANSRYTPSPARRAPEEYLEESEDNHIVWVPITLSNVLDEKDETTLLVSNQFTDNYDMMDDLIKWRGDYYQYPSITTKPVLASRNSEAELAFNALPDSSAWRGIPLNYFASTAGMYTIALSDKYGLEEVAEAFIYDASTKVRHDLKADAYIFSTDRTDNTDRFTLYVRVERKKAPEVATDIEDIVGFRNEKPCKVVVNGHVYILRGGKVYDITGKQLR